MPREGGDLEAQIGLICARTRALALLRRYPVVPVRHVTPPTSRMWVRGPLVIGAPGEGRSCQLLLILLR